MWVKTVNSKAEWTTRNWPWLIHKWLFSLSMFWLLQMLVLCLSTLSWYFAYLIYLAILCLNVSAGLQYYVGKSSEYQTTCWLVLYADNKIFNDVVGTTNKSFCGRVISLHTVLVPKFVGQFPVLVGEYYICFCSLRNNFVSKKCHLEGFADSC